MTDKLREHLQAVLTDQNNKQRAVAQQSPLFRLPLEIRHEIYSWSLDFHGVNAAIKALAEACQGAVSPLEPMALQAARDIERDQQDVRVNITPIRDWSHLKLRLLDPALRLAKSVKRPPTILFLNRLITLEALPFVEAAYEKRLLLIDTPLPMAVCSKMNFFDLIAPATLRKIKRVEFVLPEELVGQPDSINSWSTALPTDQPSITPKDKLRRLQLKQNWGSLLKFMQEFSLQYEPRSSPVPAWEKPTVTVRFGQMEPIQLNGGKLATSSAQYLKLVDLMSVY